MGGGLASAQGGTDLARASMARSIVRIVGQTPRPGTRCFSQDPASGPRIDGSNGPGVGGRARCRAEPHRRPAGGSPEVCEVWRMAVLHRRRTDGSRRSTGTAGRHTAGNRPMRDRSVVPDWLRAESCRSGSLRFADASGFASPPTQRGALEERPAGNRVVVPSCARAFPQAARGASRHWRGASGSSPNTLRPGGRRTAGWTPGAACARDPTHRAPEDGRMVRRRPAPLAVVFT